MQRIFPILFLSLLAGCDLTKSKPAETVIYEAPESKPNQVDPQDSTYLRIKGLATGYEFSVFDKKMTTTNIESLDSFIVVNKDRINKSKVLVINIDSSNSFKTLRPILLKHDISRFSISGN